MAAFDKISSGFAGLDKTLDWIRLGDNVVWQVSSVTEYIALAQRFASNAVKENRKLIYIRFAPHEPVIEDENGIIVHRLDPASGFEAFTVALHRIIADAGSEALYIFDSLSELQTAWAADLMMGNFFAVTCPYLFELDTVAWFCIIRGRHSFDTIARIRDTTQLLIDVLPDENCLYIHPIKVWKRYSSVMFFPHRLCVSNPDVIEPLTDGVSVSRFYRIAGVEAGSPEEQSLDSWERFFISARESSKENPVESKTPGSHVLKPLVRTIAEHMVGTEERILDLVTRNCSLDDLLDLKDRLIGSGKIGGKSAGMIVSRKIVGRVLPEMSVRIEPHDSAFIGSDVFYTYLVHNQLWKSRIIQRTDDGYFSEAEKLKESLLNGIFPKRVKEQFVRLLEYFGQHPVIVRSSSLLEDSFGHAFAGKYESVFCTNTGTPEERLEAFLQAIRIVYASTMDASALAYRKQRGLDNLDEQMAILVQRVSGSLFDRFFMPLAAGVGYSHNAWRWDSSIDPSAGMLRIVAGLGTRAVDRTGSDYPRIVSLSNPNSDPSGGNDRTRYSQHSIDCLDLEKRDIVTMPLDTILPVLPDWVHPFIVEHDYETERRLTDMDCYRPVFIGSCAGLVEDRLLLQDLKLILQSLQSEYNNPVDIEFTVNKAPGGDYLINLLQCRPLQTAGSKKPLEGFKIDENALKHSDKDNIFISLHRNTMGPQFKCKVDAVIIIDPLSYYNLPYKDKPGVARMIGQLNSLYREQNKNIILLAPGRIGTSSPELGVPVSFAEISNMSMIFELACSEAGYNPELSFGSHFFQDLVEADIYYGAIPEKSNEDFYNTGIFSASEKIELSSIGLNTYEGNPLSFYKSDNLYFSSNILESSCICGRVL
ncbi:MAG TPA: PEP/pyruvate-binding domain-containing protein [Spirochaetota bacterium]|nr:PEP/pyruvate-binding domain-containing protein [Spirochaetota bacterium]